MHWLLLLALLSSSTDLKGGGSSSSLSRMAETSLRRQLGTVRNVNVQVTPGASRIGGDFDSFIVSLDGFSADNLAGLANQTGTAGSSRDPGRDTYSLPGGDVYPSDNSQDSLPGGYGLPRYDAARRSNLGAEDIGDILGGIGGGDFGGIGGVLGDVLGGGKKGGRIGRIRLRATNFSFQGARYDAMSADLGEIRFDWKKALRGDFDIKSMAPGTLSLSLRGDQAARLLSPRLPSLSNVKVRFANGRAFVGAKSELHGLRVPFEVGARLSVQQNRVIANDFAASVARLRLPSFVLDEVTRGVNPLYDFDPQGRWPLAINLSTAQASGDVLAMRGGVQWIGFGGDRNRTGNDRGQSRYPDQDLPRDRNGDTSRDRNSRDRSPESILGDIFGR